MNNKEFIKERTIRVDGYSEYDNEIIHFIFPPVATREDQEEYLKDNYLPFETTYYDIDKSDGRDCTGQIYKAYVQYEGRLVTIIAYLDL